MAEKEWQKARLGVWRPSCQTTLCSDHISLHSSLFILLCKWALPSFKGLTISKQLVFFFGGGGGVWGGVLKHFLSNRYRRSKQILNNKDFIFKCPLDFRSNSEKKILFLVHPMTWRKQCITATLKTKRQKSQDAMGKLGCLTVSGLLPLLEHGF